MGGRERGSGGVVHPDLPALGMAAAGKKVLCLQPKALCFHLPIPSPLFGADDPSPPHRRDPTSGKKTPSTHRKSFPTRRHCGWGRGEPPSICPRPAQRIPISPGRLSLSPLPPPQKKVREFGMGDPPHTPQLCVGRGWGRHSPGPGYVPTPTGTQRRFPRRGAGSSTAWGPGGSFLPPPPPPSPPPPPPPPRRAAGRAGGLPPSPQEEGGGSSTDGCTQGNIWEEEEEEEEGGRTCAPLGDS